MPKINRKLSYSSSANKQSKKGINLREINLCGPSLINEKLNDVSDSSSHSNASGIVVIEDDQMPEPIQVQMDKKQQLIEKTVQKLAEAKKEAAKEADPPKPIITIDQRMVEDGPVADPEARESDEDSNPKVVAIYKSNAVVVKSGKQKRLDKAAEKKAQKLNPTGAAKRTTRSRGQKQVEVGNKKRTKMEVGFTEPAEENAETHIPQPDREWMNTEPYDKSSELADLPKKLARLAELEIAIEKEVKYSTACLSRMDYEYRQCQETLQEQQLEMAKYKSHYTQHKDCARLQVKQSEEIKYLNNLMRNTQLDNERLQGQYGSEADRLSAAKKAFEKDKADYVPNADRLEWAQKESDYQYAIRSLMRERETARQSFAAHVSAVEAVSITNQVKFQQVAMLTQQVNELELEGQHINKLTGLPQMIPVVDYPTGQDDPLYKLNAKLVAPFIEQPMTNVAHKIRAINTSPPKQSKKDKKSAV